MADESSNWLYGEKVARLLMDAGYVQPGDYVLDFGAAAGRLTTPLLTAGCNVIAVEMNGERRAMLRDRNRDAEREGRLTVYARGDVPAISVNVSIAFFVLQHLPLNYAASILDDMTVWSSRAVVFTYPSIWRKHKPPSGYIHADFDRTEPFDPMGQAPSDRWSRFLWSDEIRELIRHRRYQYAYGFSKQHFVLPLATE